MRAGFGSRQFDDQLVEMDSSDAAKTLAVRVVAESYSSFFLHDRKFGELEEVMQKVLNIAMSTGVTVLRCR